MTDAEVRAALEAAVEQLIEREAGLLELNVGEQTIAYHLSKYIEQAIPAEFTVDVEYNRHGTAKKVLLLPPKDFPDHPAIPTVVRPDVVVHSRGNDATNLLVVEVKKPKQGLARDQQKLQAFREQYEYRNAAHVVLGYRNGRLVREVIWFDV